MEYMSFRGAVFYVINLMGKAFNWKFTENDLKRLTET